MIPAHLLLSLAVPCISLSTRHETSGTWYSGGMVLGLFGSLIAISTASSIVCLSSPVRVMVPVSRASGLSVASRRFMAGKSSMADSSLMVPLSLMVHRACFCKLT